MTDGMDERRRSLENEYFRKKDQEAIDKLRAKMKVAEDAKSAGLSSMKCPRCSGNLTESNFEGVMIDTCDNCSGVWLDPGEFGQLVQKEGKAGWFSRFWNAQD
jgi:uncharacterized protein